MFSFTPSSQPISSQQEDKPALQRNLFKHTDDVALYYVKSGPGLDHNLTEEKNRSKLLFYPVSAECHCMFFDFGFKINEVGCFCHYSTQDMVVNSYCLFACPLTHHSADTVPPLLSPQALQLSSRRYQATVTGDSLRAAPSSHQRSGGVCFLCKKNVRYLDSRSPLKTFIYIEVKR